MSITSSAVLLFMTHNVVPDPGAMQPMSGQIGPAIISKSSNSKPGPTVQPTSAYAPRVRAACHSPARITCTRCSASSAVICGASLVGPRQHLDRVAFVEMPGLVGLHAMPRAERSLDEQEVDRRERRPLARRRRRVTRSSDLKTCRYHPPSGCGARASVSINWRARGCIANRLSRSHNQEAPHVRPRSSHSRPSSRRPQLHRRALSSTRRSASISTSPNRPTGVCSRACRCPAWRRSARAVEAAEKAQPGWAGTPIKERAQVFYRYKALLEKNITELGELVTAENGKVRGEAEAEVLKSAELCEFACSLPQIIPGEVLEVSRGVECRVERYPVGIVASITPFNFPNMVPNWTIPNAIALGNCMILKPSEQVPLSAGRIAELLREAGLPDGVLNIVHGGQATVEAICDAPGIEAISFVGSTHVAKIVYRRGSTNLKRVLALGGAKNHLIVMPDAEPEMTPQRRRVDVRLRRAALHGRLGDDGRRRHRSHRRPHGGHRARRWSPASTSAR